MRHIILVLIALVALGGLLPSAVAAPAKTVGLSDKSAVLADPADTSLVTTASMADFLNDSWTPSSFVPPLADSAKAALKNGTLKNSTYSAYDFLKGNYTAEAPQSPVYSASAQQKDGTVHWTGESIYQFLDPNWTPSTAVEVVHEGLYTQHQMS
jgi:hypothetical protein